MGGGIVTDGERGLFERPRVNALLEKAAGFPVVTVTAGAGYGKTQAVGAFAGGLRGAVTFWMQLSALDNLGERFWENFVKTIAAVNAGLASRLAEAGFPASERQLERCFELIKSESAPGGRRLFVLDDFHLIESAEVLRFIGRAMAEPFRNVTQIIISRAEPDVNMLGLLARGRVSRVDENDLKFDKDELRAYFGSLGISLQAQEETDIYIATGGWPFAVRLISLAMQDGAERLGRALASMKSGVFKLMEAEIFEPLPEEWKRLLVKLALIEHMPSALLRELAEGEERLVKIGKISAFIRYDAYADEYRAHKLFIEFLRGRRGLLTREDEKEVYARAAGWHRENGFLPDAAMYYERAEDYRGLADAAHALTRMTPPRVAHFLLGLLDRTPERAYEEDTRLHVIRIKLYQSLARFDEARAEALRVIELYEGGEDSPEKHRLLSECWLNLGYIGIFTSLYTGEYDYAEFFEKGYRHYELGGRVPFGPRERALVASYVCRVGCPAGAGALERGNRLFAGYAHYAEKAKDGMFSGMAELASCEAAYYKADVGNAGRLANIAMRKAREAEQFQIEHRALMLLLRVNIHFASPPRLAELMRKLEEMLGYEEFLNRYTLHDIVTGWFYAQTRRTRLVPAWLKSEFEKSDLNALSFGLESIVRAKYFLAEKRYPAALAALEGGGEYGPEAFLLGRIETAAHRAVCLYHAGEKGAAMDTLRGAYELSKDDGLDMPFIELGRDMRTLTAAARKSGDRSIPLKWLETIHKKSSTYAKKLAYIISEENERSGDADEAASLTVRERDILADICHGLSRSEMAASRGLSVNTVKASIQIIYKKLGAQNTADAIRVAVRRGLIQ
ncbi:MAG: LuxR C-terminal-related transcriptional regulator [Oscillospiraceae bacterium]|jgi:LuxR family maltose regulon positive regulatory protein|nr:LuxR C-terminal-related transcriptional regulator [Oscillospiraceae bacterium]